MDWQKWLAGFDGWMLVGLWLGGLIATIAVALLVYLIFYKNLLRFAERPDTALRGSQVRRWRSPAKLLFPVILLKVITPPLGLPSELKSILEHLLSLLFIGGLAWLFAETVIGLRDLVLRQYDLKARDNFRARAVHTQVNVLMRLFLVSIFVIATASMLMTFDQIRQLGVSLLASAGIAGIIVGFAAQRSLGTLFAGIQIAITQPIRIDDVVIVEGEWGRVEEITLTYVVVCVWDRRRLIVPITWFLERPFQNWTRGSTDILGTVIIHADYSVPVAAVRGELERIVANEPLWDGEVVGLQVTNANDRTLELRALVSAADSGSAWDLRCLVREKLIDFLRREYPQSLPRLRADMTAEAAEAAISQGVPGSPDQPLDPSGFRPETN